jgi:solute carrier family 25 carnitine/acylcarnitine transporter 20/29
VRLQLSDKSIKARTIIKSIWRNQGAKGFFKGAASPMICRAPLTAWFFTSHEMIKPRLASYDLNQNLSNFLCGAWAGFSLLPVLVPVELFKCKAQTAKGGVYSYKQDFRNVIKTQGPQGLYRGSLATLYREVPGSGILFMSKDLIERKIGANNENQSYSSRMAKKVLAGGGAGLCAWCTSLPIDTVKSIIQTSAEQRYIGEVTAELYKNGGVTPFFRGIVPQAFRIFPASSSLLIVYELLKNYMN